MTLGVLPPSDVPGGLDPFPPPAIAGGSGSPVTISITAPVGPGNGDLWFKPDEPSLKLYYDDGDSQQWIDLWKGCCT